MKVIKRNSRYAILPILLSVACLNPPAATAAPLALTDEPLYLQTSAKSNLFFLFDNTGSMESETITRDQTQSQVYSRGIEAGTGNVISICTGVGCSSGSGASAQRFRAPAYNTLFYNPTKTYNPWPNSNAADCTFTNAIVDPTNPSTTKFANLSVSWSPYLSGNTGAGYYDYNETTSSVSTFHPVPDTAATVAEQNRQKQNFANWFCYHRTRMLAAKSAILNVINTIPENVPIRIGVNTFKNDNYLGLTDIKAADLSDTSDTGVIARNSMIAAIKPWEFCGSGDYGSGTCPSGTNTFAALTRAGHYFKCDSSTFQMGAPGSPTGRTTGACAYDIIPTDEKTCAANFVAIVTDGEFDDSASSTADNTTVTNPIVATYPSYVTDVHKSSTSNTLADLAMSLYNADFFNTIDDKVPIRCGVDENPGQHLVTFAVSMGIPTDVTAPTTQPKLGIAPNCTASTTAEITSLQNQVSGTSKTLANRWRETSSLSAFYKQNQMVHAAYNGRGKFFNASSSSELTENLVDIANEAGSRHSAAASVGLSGTTNNGSTQVYLSQFYSGAWIGELFAYTLNSDGTLPATPTWEAHSLLDTLSNGTNAGSNSDTRGVPNRTIITYKPTNTAPPYAAGFTWSNLTTDQQNDLRTNTSTGSVTTDSVTVAQLKLNFIRGDHRCEQGTASTASAFCINDPAASTPIPDIKYFRNRPQRLGDFINSAPVYVKEAVGNYASSGVFPSGTSSYASFKNGTLASGVNPFTSGKTAATRTAIIYIGGNDGMLHAFNARTDTPATPATYGGNKGEEVFAFIPAAVYGTSTTSGLHKLAEGDKHISYVDQTPTIADAYITTHSDTTRKWRTVLVGAMRHGGKGVFALDVTDPDHIINTGLGAARETAAATHALWEYSNATVPTDNDLGFSYSQPVIVPLRIANGNSTNAIAWFAIFGNGYNSVNGRAVLYLLRLSGPGTDETWNGNEIYKIDTSIGAAAASGDPNGLSSPAVIDSDGDGIYDRAYAGDLYGNMWAFNLSGDDPSTDWGVSYAGEPLFQQGATTDSTEGKAKPITAKPVVIRNTVTGTDPNTIVLFGTGSYLKSGDQTVVSPLQSFYGVADHGASAITPASGTLVEQTLTTSQITDVDSNTVDVRTISSNTVDYSTKHGWYMDFTAGERAVSTPTLLGNTLIFTTIIPTSAPCGGGGSSWLMGVNPFTGQSPSIVTFDANGDGVVNALDNLSGSVIVGIKDQNMTPEYSFVAGPAAQPDETPPCPEGSFVQGIGTSTNAGTTSQYICAEGGSGKAGRFSWRQLKFE